MGKQHLMDASGPPLGWRVVFGLAEPDLPGWGQVRGAQIEALIRLLPVICLTHIFNALVLVAALWNEVPASRLLGWSVSLLAMLVLIARFAETAREHHHESASRGTLIRAIAYAGMLGALWAIPPAFFSGHAPLEQDLAICLVGAGVVATAALATSSLPLATLAFTVFGGVGLTAMMVEKGAYLLAVLPIVYGLGLTAGSAAVGRAFIGRTWAEISLAEKKEEVSLLLREFEDRNADWLWQADAAKRLVNVSSRFAHAAGAEVDALEGTPLLRLLAGSAWETGIVEPSLKELIDRLNARESFAHLDLPLLIGDERRWWRLSATPRWTVRPISSASAASARTSPSSIARPRRSIGWRGSIHSPASPIAATFTIRSRRCSRAARAATIAAGCC
jgi:hypothetical protein